MTAPSGGFQNNDTTRNHDYERRLTTIETLVKSTLASREWVAEELHLVKGHCARTEGAVQTLADKFAELAAGLKGVYATQNQLLQERVDQTRREHEERIDNQRLEHEATMEVLKREHEARVEALQLTAAQLREQTFLSRVKEIWVPVTGFFLTALAILQILSGGAQAWLKSHGFG